MMDIVKRLRAASSALLGHYPVGAIERIPADTMTEAADTIEALHLAGWAVWNNLLNGDIEAHTQEASNALQLLNEALAKAGVQ
jgi:hypothetical protein